MSCCGHSGCACIVNGGDGITVTGSGSPSDPYVVTSNITELTGLIGVQDSTSVNLTLTGSGTIADPLQLRAVAILKMTELADVNDPSGGPAVGESPVWVGAGSDGHWEFQIPPPSPAGAVNVENGLYGLGDVSDPIGVETSGVWGVGSLAGLGGDSTIGLPIYIDSAGKVRAKPVGTPAWTDITGKPTTFPPSAHTHVAADITDPENLDVGRVNGVKLFSTPTSASPPSVGVLAGDIWVFPKGS